MNNDKVSQKLWDRVDAVCTSFERDLFLFRLCEAIGSPYDTVRSTLKRNRGGKLDAEVLEKWVIATNTTRDGWFDDNCVLVPNGGGGYQWRPRLAPGTHERQMMEAAQAEAA